MRLCSSIFVLCFIYDYFVTYFRFCSSNTNSVFRPFPPFGFPILALKWLFRSKHSHETCIQHFERSLSNGSICYTSVVCVKNVNMRPKQLSACSMDAFVCIGLFMCVHTAIFRLFETHLGNFRNFFYKKS